MITAEQEEFIRKYVGKDYFDVNRVIEYLKLHEAVGGDICVSCIARIKNGASKSFGNVERWIRVQCYR